MADKEDHKRDNKRRNFDKTLREISRNETEDEALISFHSYGFSKGVHEEMTNAEDEWGLQNGAVYNLNAKGRWNLPDLVAQKQEETETLLEKGELRGAPLVLVINVMSSRRAEQVLSAGLDSRMLIGPGDARGHNHSSDSDSSDFDEEEEEEEEEVKAPDNRQYEVVLNRKGRKLVEVGARRDKKRERNRITECKKLQHLNGNQPYNGPLHVYMLFDPKVAKKTVRTRGYSCDCPMCAGWAPEGPRSKRNRDAILEQL